MKKYKNKETATAAANEYAMERMDSGSKVWKSETKGLITITHSCDFGGNVSRRFEYKHMSAGEVCIVYGVTPEPRKYLKMFSGRYSRTGNEPLFLDHLNDDNGRTWENYIPTGFNVLKDFAGVCRDDQL